MTSDQKAGLCALQKQLAAHVTVFAGGSPHMAFENTGEIALIVKTDCAGNFCNRHGAFPQIDLAALNAQAVDIFGESAAELVLKDAAKIGFGQIYLLCSLLERQLVRKMLLNIRSCFANDVLVLDFREIKHKTDKLM